MYGKRKRIVAGALSMFAGKRSGKPAARKRVHKRPKLAMRLKFGKKRAGPPTSTTRTMNVEATANGHSAINTQTVKVGNWKKPKAQTAGTWNYQQSYRYNLASQAGVQAVNNIVIPLHYSKIFTSSGPTYASYQNFTALEQMNPAINGIVGGAYVGASNPLNDRFIVNTCNLQLELTNFSVVACFMDVYITCCSRDTAKDAVSTWADGLAIQALGNVQAAQPPAATGSVAVGNGTVGFPAITGIDNHPREAKLFGQFYKTHKVKRLMLVGGSSETLNIDIGINKVVKCETLRELSSGGAGYLKGLTWHIFVVQRGSLVEDNAPGAGGNPQLPTYGATKVGCIVQEKYRMCGVKNNSSRLTTSLQYSNVPFGTLPTYEGVLNEVDQVVSVLSATV